MKSRIKEVKYPKSDAKGNSCLLVLEDKTEGWYNYKGDFIFTVGEEIEYSTTQKPKVSKPGEFNIIISPSKLGQIPVTSAPAPQPQGAVKPPNTSAVSTAKSFTEMKFEGRIVCIKLAVECILQGKFEKADAMEAFAEWVTVLDASIDELKTK